MDTALESEFLSVEDYLAGEETSPIRHEYVGGIAYAMAGSSEEHNIIAGNIFSELRANLRGGPCKVFIADIKTRLFLANRNLFYYPDVMVTCDPKDSDRFYKRFPKVIVEVLSDGTENTDRREKFWNYTQFDSLEDYVLVSQSKMEVTLFRRGNDWKPEILRQSQDELSLNSLGFKITLQSVYEGVNF